MTDTESSLDGDELAADKNLDAALEQAEQWLGIQGGLVQQDVRFVLSLGTAPIDKCNAPRSTATAVSLVELQAATRVCRAAFSGGTARHRWCETLQRPYIVLMGKNAAA